jgi:16S rRNA (adenine1518-N6/adenine1519-N6)-dimethyltransferase
LLAGGARQVVAIERDARCLSALSEVAAAYPGRLELIAGDALDIDLATISQAPRMIVANLPYNIATRLCCSGSTKSGNIRADVDVSARGR